VAQDLVTSSGYTLDALSQRSPGALLAVTARMKVAIEDQEIEARNILGILPGSDPQHRGEIVVIGAHYDHLGRDPDGAVYHGPTITPAVWRRCWKSPGCGRRRAFAGAQRAVCRLG